MSASPARVAALETLRAVRQGALADRALYASFAALPPRDRAWLQELVYGTLRLRGRIDHMLRQLSHRPLDRLQPDVLDILRLGTYQLLEMQSVPAYAAVSQSVDLAKGVSNAGGLVNGVLQSLIRAKGTLGFPSWEEDPVGHLSTWGSHPRWLVERWLARFGRDGARALIEANNRRPESYLRPIGVSVEQARERLVAGGIDARPVVGVRDSVRIPAAIPTSPGTTAFRPAAPPGANSGPVGAPAALAVVPSVIQDPAATLVVEYAALPAGALIADLAAAPGGKALALAGPTDHSSPRYVVANDVSFERNRLVRENARRVGQLPLGIIVADARRPPFRPATFDAVLLDAPCTGTGTFRRRPDGRWRITMRDLEALARLQRELLRSAAQLVRRGGLLVYATCSIEAEENELQVEALLDEMREFEIEPSAAVPPEFLDRRGHLLVLPQRSGFDGAFAARLRRN